MEFYLSDSRYAEIWSLNQEQVSELYSETGGRYRLMDRLLEWLAQRDGVQANTPVFRHAQKAVERQVGAILAEIAAPLVEDLGGGFEVRRESMGSASENTKVGSPDEFDYLISLTPASGRHLFDLQPSDFRATKAEFVPKSYCDVTLTNTEGWNPHLLENNRLLPGKVKNRFFELVKQASAKGCRVTQKGPAVTLYLQVKGLADFIKVDMCLALVTNRESVDSCLRQAESQLRLPPNVTACDVFHVICSGGYWKLSVCQAENMYMRALDANAKNLYKVLKVLKDDVAITHNLEDPCMGSYPLKVALMHHVEEMRSQGRMRALIDDGMYFNALRVLRLVDQTVESEGTPSLCSYMMVDDPVFKESERSYLEARRVAVYFHKLREIFFLYGMINTGYLAILFIMGAFSIFYVLNNRLSWLDYSRNNHQVVMSSIKLFIGIGLVGQPWHEWHVRKQMLGSPHRKRKSFVANCCMMFYFLVFIIVYTIELVCWVKLVHYEVEPSSRMSMYYTVRNTETLIPCMILLHLFLTLWFTKGNIREHRWEWVYVDPLLMQCLVRYVVPLVRHYVRFIRPK